MSRAIAPPERGIVAAPARRSAWWWSSAVLYAIYPVAVCIALAMGRPRLAVASTLLALGVAVIGVGRWRTGLVLAAASPLVALVPLGDVAQPLVYLPPIALNLALAAWFGATLRPGREPVISAFARIERGELPPPVASYTRTLTAVWVAFFLTSASVALLLALFAPTVVWGAFVAFGNHVAVALLFVGEWLFRRWHFPDQQHSSPVRLVRIVAGNWRRALAQ